MNYWNYYSNSKFIVLIVKTQEINFSLHFLSKDINFFCTLKLLIIKMTLLSYIIYVWNHAQERGPIKCPQSQKSVSIIVSPTMIVTLLLSHCPAHQLRVEKKRKIYYQWRNSSWLCVVWVISKSQEFLVDWSVWS